MALIYLSLGSNIDREHHIGAALDALTGRFGALEISTVYESVAVGFDGDSFFNLVVGVNSDLPVGEVTKILKHIEDCHGRDRSAPKFGPRSLDIDILTVDNLAGEFDGISLPRSEVLKNAFVLQPLAELAADMTHPLTHKTIGEHWQEFDKASQDLWPVKFEWQSSV
ncbi:MAG: 2-amino-4-hydroxy-6-hydroxymethyldihydropteridine diphosphokinase [Porticoccaceae bacterium]|nr:2-amino-4-hydroxy-6-hydroxymethyldihydropteridine diphosphokinase [Porticoccaceae bacterium]